MRPRGQVPASPKSPPDREGGCRSSRAAKRSIGAQSPAPPRRRDWRIGRPNDPNFGDDAILGVHLSGASVVSLRRQEVMRKPSCVAKRTAAPSIPHLRMSTCGIRSGSGSNGMRPLSRSPRTAPARSRGESSLVEKDHVLARGDTITPRPPSRPCRVSLATLSERTSAPVRS